MTLNASFLLLFQQNQTLEKKAKLQKIVCSILSHDRFFTLLKNKFAPLTIGTPNIPCKLNLSTFFIFKIIPRVYMAFISSCILTLRITVPPLFNRGHEVLVHIFIPFFPSSTAITISNFSFANKSNWSI